MLNESQFLEIAQFVKDFMYSSVLESEQEWIQNFPRAAEHRWQHTMNVLANAEEILRGEKMNEDQSDVVRTAALLHDVSMFTCDHSVHGQVSADIASKFLAERGYEDDFVRRVARAIVDHGADFGDLPSKEQGEMFSWEGRVLVEADILDKIGAAEVTSALIILGMEGKLYFEALGSPRVNTMADRAEFFKDYFWTETGKRLAERRYSFLLEFLARLGEEVVTYDMPSFAKLKSP